MATVYDIDFGGRLPALEVQEVSVDFGPREVVKDVSMAIPANGVVALVGASGCGKTTLLKCFNRMNDLNPEAEVRGRVLDVGAGAGRAALHLQDLDHDVTALDVSPRAVEVCRRRGISRTFLGSVGDLEAETPGGFDTFLFFGQNLGLLGSPEAVPDWMGRLRRLGRPGARLVGTLLDPYITDDPAHLDYHEQNRRQGRMPGQVRVRVRHGLLATPWFELLWMSGDELRALTGPQGWEVIDHRQDGASQSVVLEMR